MAHLRFNESEQRTRAVLPENQKRADNLKKLLEGKRSRKTPKLLIAIAVIFVALGGSYASGVNVSSLGIFQTRIKIASVMPRITPTESPPIRQAERVEVVQVPTPDPQMRQLVNELKTQVAELRSTVQTLQRTPPPAAPQPATVALPPPAPVVIAQNIPPPPIVVRSRPRPRPVEDQEPEPVTPRRNRIEISEPMIIP